MRDNVIAAKTALRDLCEATPLQRNAHLSAKYDADVYLKREDLSPVRSYKLRGAFNFMRKRMGGDGASKVFVCASAGNHAQGFAFSCRHFGVKGVVFMPVTTPQQKIDKTRTFGEGFIRIELVGDIFDVCYSAARTFASEHDGIMVPPFDHPDIIEGQATVASEIEDAWPEGEGLPDLIVMPVGGGGLSAGITSYFSDRLPDDAYLFAEPEGAPSLKRSLEAGEIVTLEDVDNFVDGAAVARIGDANFEALRRFSPDQVMAVPENALCVTMTEMLNVEGVVLEPAGALALTALVYRSLSWEDFRVAVVNSVRTTAMVMILIGFAGSFAYLLALYQVSVGGPIQIGPLSFFGGNGIIPFGLFIDRLTAVMMVLVTSVSIVIHIFASRYLQEEPGYTRFYTLLSLITFVLLALVASPNLLMLFVFWQLLSWTLYLLLAYNITHLP
ncbi:MAG: pyridoxal-phosphate dependent enzyme, partial [Martelella sp.]